MVDRECEHCGAVFKTYQSRIANGKARYCQRRCAYDARAGVPLGGLPEGIKKCSRCKTDKSVQDFTIDRARVDGLSPWCRTCCGAAARTPQAKASRRNAEERRRQRDPDYDRRFNLLRLYNLTIEQYRQMLDDQDGRCAICRCLPDTKALHVDHDHRCCPTGRSCGRCIRALLCGRCNTAVGWIEKFGQDWNRNVTQYVAQWEKVLT